MPKGIPLSGDRAAWDADNYPDKHANDIDTTDGIHHTIGTGAGQVAPGIHTHVEADITDLDHTDVNAIHDNVSGEIAAIAEKTTPVDADVTLIEDSAASNAKKRLSWSNIKVTLKTYFDAIYAALSHTHVEADITDLDHDAAKIDGIAVDLTGIADGNALVYDSGTSKIVPGEGGGGGHEIQDNGTPMTQRAALNFIGLEVTDDAGNDATKVTLPDSAYAETIGNNSDSDFNIVHDLGTEDIIVQLWDLTGTDPVEATADASAITIVDADTINVAFASPPVMDAYRVVVLKSGGGGGETHDTIFTFLGDLEVGDHPLKIHNKLGKSQLISQVFLSCTAAPTGADLIVDIHKSGTTIFTTQSHRPTITAGSTEGYTTSIDVSNWADGEYLTAHIDQIGSGTPGANLVVHVIHS